MRAAYRNTGRGDLRAGSLGSKRGKMSFPWENREKIFQGASCRGRNSHVPKLSPLRKGEGSGLQLSPDVGLIELGSGSGLVNEVSQDNWQVLGTSFATRFRNQLGWRGETQILLSPQLSHLSWAGFSSSVKKWFLSSLCSGLFGENKTDGVRGGQPSQLGVPAGEVPAELGTSLRGTLVQVSLGQPRFSLICCKVMGVNRQPGGIPGCCPRLCSLPFPENVCRTYFEETWNILWRDYKIQRKSFIWQSGAYLEGPSLRGKIWPEVQEQSPLSLRCELCLPCRGWGSDLLCPHMAFGCRAGSPVARRYLLPQSGWLGMLALSKQPWAVDHRNGQMLWCGSV